MCNKEFKWLAKHEFPYNTHLIIKLKMSKNNIYLLAVLTNVQQSV